MIRISIIKKELLSRYSDICYFRHEKNQGKGAAIQTAIRNLRGDLAIIQDADLEYDPKDYPALMKCFENPSTQVVYGSRFLSGRRVTNSIHYGVNRLITAFGNMLFGSKLTDLETCYKMFRSKTLKSLGVVSNGFEIEAEITSKVLKAKIQIVEVPISYRGRNYQQGKKITWADGFKALWALIKYRFSE